MLRTEGFYDGLITIASKSLNNNLHDQGKEKKAKFYKVWAVQFVLHHKISLSYYYIKTCMQFGFQIPLIKHVNPIITPNISLVILIIICHTILMTLVQRIWYWIDPLLIFFLYSHCLSACYHISTVGKILSWSFWNCGSVVCMFLNRFWRIQACWEQ